MKKVKLFLVAALVFGVILSSYGVSGTYAKYVSELSATADQARVARWNFGIKDGSLEEGDFSNTVKLNLFASSYKCKTSDNGNCVQALTQTENEQPGSTSADKVVAPGTSGSAKIQISIDAETAFTLKFGLGAADGNKVVLTDEEVKAALSNDTSLISKLKEKRVLNTDETYSPIRFSLNGQSGNGHDNVKVENIEYSKFAESLNLFISKMQGNDTFKKNYFLLKNGSTVVTDGDSPVFQPKSKKGTSLPLELGWKWEFESTVLDDSDGSIKKAVDKLDTALASKSGKTIDFNLKVDIQQYNG